MHSSVKLLNRGDVRIGCLEPGTHGIHRQVGRPDSPPVFGLLRPRIRRAIGDAHPPFDADAGRVTPSSPRITAHTLQRRLSHSVRLKLWKPTIRETSNAFNHRFNAWPAATEPHWDRALDG